MKINKRKRKKSKSIVIAIVATIASGTLLLICLLLIYRPPTNTPNSKSTSDSTPQQRQESTDNNLDSKHEAPNSDSAPDPVPSNSSNKKQVQVTATVDVSDDVVFIRGGVNYPVSDGSCYAELQGPSSQLVRKDTALLPNPATSDCRTIQIPVSELAKGGWVFVLYYASDNYEGASSAIRFTL